MSERKNVGALGSKAKQIVLNVCNYFLNEYQRQRDSYIDSTAKATGVSRSTVYRIRKEQKDTGMLGSPQRSERGAYKPVDDFDDIVIRNKVHDFYTVRRQLPTLINLHSVLKTDIDYPGSITTLRKTVRKLGFRWKKTNDNRKVLVEKPSVVSLRLNFYRRKKELEDLGFELVYVDETWIDTAYCAKHCWQGPNTPGVIPPCNRGQRLIVVNAGSKKGFIPGAQLIYRASSSTGDYHREMNGANFTKWIEQQLLPNLDCPCAIVMDNASYHSMQTDRCPTSSTRKADIKEWLRRHHIPFNETMLRPELLGIARAHRQPPSYAIDQLVRENGHEVLRLPPYHPDFNAIEIIWSQLKTIIRQKNTTFRLDDVLKIATAAFEEIGEDRWQRACEHVDKVVQQHRTSDHFIDEQMDSFVINLADDSSSDSTDDSSTDTASETEC